MNILMISPQGGAVGYYRSWLPARALNNTKQHKATYFSHDIGFFHALKDLHKCTNEDDMFKWFIDNAINHDIIHMGYTTTMPQVMMVNGALRNYLQQNNHDIPILVDIDDDPINVPTYNTAFKYYRFTSQEKKSLLIHLRTSDGVTVTCDHLGKVLIREGKRFDILPNYCNPDDWPEWCRNPQRHEDKSIRMLFAGGPGHHGDLAAVEESIEWAMGYYNGKNGRPNLRLFFLGCTPEWVMKWLRDSKNPANNRCFYLQPSTISTYWEQLNYVEPDIVFSPIEANEFNKSKSCIKAYDAAMCGAAFLCTDWDTYDDVPDDTCIKAYSPTQWKESLGQLIESPQMRTKLHSKLLDWVLTERQIKDNIHKWVDVYESAIKRPTVQGISDIVRPRIITGD